MTTGDVAIRVRYAETDRMGLLHHANYLVYFEQARTELLRALGTTYKDLEDKGFLLVLTKVEVRYRKPAQYDDLLTVRTTVERVDVRQDRSPLRGAARRRTPRRRLSSTLACVDRDGRPQALPDFLRQG